MEAKGTQRRPAGPAMAQAHWRPLLGTVVAASLFLLAACVAPLGPLQGNTRAIVVGEDRLAAQVITLSGTPALPALQAVAVAKRYVTTWSQSGDIRPRYVALTLRTNTGTIAWGIQNHPVWLVQFPGARYAPAAYPESGCACDRTFQPPNTDVAIDAQTGELVMDFGLTALLAPQ